MSVIVITGASGGIAQEIVKQLPPKHQLVLLGRDTAKLENLYGELSHVTCLAVDLSNEETIKSCLDTIYSQYNNIDVLINNAGFGTFKTYDDYNETEVRDMFTINTFAVMTLSRLVAQKMTKQDSGHIITIASMAGLIASAKSSVYSASKFAVIGFSNALRLEVVDKGVYVTTVNPGPIKTPFFDKADPSGEYLESVDRFVLEAQVVAKKIIAIIGKNKRELNMPLSLKAVHLFYTLFPNFSDYFARKVFHYK